MVDDLFPDGYEAVFIAAGDIVSGPKTVIEAVAFTKKVFERMQEYLKDNAG